MEEVISYKVLQRILSSWELASQKYGSREQIGLDVLLYLFRIDPTAKSVFGFTEHQNVEGNTMLRMGAFVHGTRIYSMLDQMISFVGPDTEILLEFLETLGERHKRLGVRKEHFTVLADGVRTALANTLGDAYSPEYDSAWKEFLGTTIDCIVKNMD
jgi:hemoglobin-like flavoprotein